jgi:hypothetical protein
VGTASRRWTTPSFDQIQLWQNLRLQLESRWKIAAAIRWRSHRRCSPAEQSPPEFRQSPSDQTPGFGWFPTCFNVCLAILWVRVCECFFHRKFTSASTFYNDAHRKVARSRFPLGVQLDFSPPCGKMCIALRRRGCPALNPITSIEFLERYKVKMRSAVQVHQAAQPLMRRRSAGLRDEDWTDPGSDIGENMGSPLRLKCTRAGFP